jgi:hypothetical protein
VNWQYGTRSITDPPGKGLVGKTTVPVSTDEDVQMGQAGDDYFIFLHDSS